MRARVLGTIVLAAAGLALAGCASTASAGSGGTPPALATTTTATQSNPSPTGLTAQDADNGRTITMSVGERITVTLHNTYWHFADPTGTALRTAGQHTTTTPLNGPGHCVPGQGCGTVATWYDAVAPGTATVTASRTSCGEARGCTGNDGSYRLTVVVR